MNILNLLKYSPDFGGGISKHLLALGKIAKLNGHKLFIGFPEKRIWQDELSEFATIIIIPELNKSFSKALPGIINNICRKHSIDIIHAHFNFGIPFSLAFPLKKNSLPFVYHWHNPPLALNEVTTSQKYFKYNFKRLFGTLIARFTDFRKISQHISISQEITNILVENHWTSKDKISFLPNGIAVPKSNTTIRFLKKEKIKIIGTVANFRPQKDHETLIKAFSLVLSKELNAELWIVGEGPTKNSIEILAQELGVFSKVKFLGVVLNPSELFEKFDIFVLSTNYEGHPLVLLEAMSYSLPIVATRISSIPEVIEDGVNGLLVNPKDPMDLANVLVSILHEEALYEKLSQQASLSFERQLTVDQWSEKMISIYKDRVG